MKHTKGLKYGFRTGLGGMVLLVVLCISAGAGELFELDRFIAPVVCSDCHSDIYNQWQSSTHSLAHKDPLYRQMTNYVLGGVKDKDERQEAEACVKCHTPVGVVTGNPGKTSDDLTAVPDIAKQGVQCDYCHSATGTTRMYNNGLTLSPGHGELDPGIKRGPRDDAVSSFHDSRYSEFHTGSEICGTCHNVKHVVFMTDLETTYAEWADSPYNSKDPARRVTCQGCHMYQRPGVPATGATARPDNPGYASDFGPERKHVFTHNFVGGNAYVPGLFDGDAQITMAEERLQNAARLSLDTGNLKNREIRIEVTNIGAGHDLPTGLTHARQMWLDITVVRKTEEGEPVVWFSSGQLDADRYLPADTIVYHTVFGDGRGNPVINIARAREILKDKRIPPRETAVESVILPPEAPTEGLVVSVKLCYRSFPQKVLDRVAGKKMAVLPVIVMAELEQQL